MKTSYTEKEAVWLALLITVLLMWIPTFASSFRGEFVHTWAYTELLINWAGGFVRRGLYGSLAIAFHNLTGFGVVGPTTYIFLIATLIQIASLFLLLWQYRANYALLFLVGLSPTMLLFAAYDDQAYWRKESFLNVAILIHAILARLYLSDIISYKRYIAAFAFFLVPMLILNTLIYEVQGLFIPVHIALSLSILQHHKLVNPGRGETYSLITFGYLLAFAPFILSVFAHGDAQKSAEMWNAVKLWSGAPADLGFVGFGGGWTNAIDAHGWTFGTEVARVRSVITDPKSFLPFLGAFLVGPVMLSMLIRSQISDCKYSLHVWSHVPSLLLFIIGLDYGRWIHMIAMSAVAHMLHYPSKSGSPSRIRLESTSVYSWVAPFLLFSWVVLYTLGWHLRHVADPNQNFDPRFMAVWLDLLDVVKNIFR